MIEQFVLGVLESVVGVIVVVLVKCALDGVEKWLKRPLP